VPLIGRTRLVFASVLCGAALGVCALNAPGAAAFNEFYGGGSLCGSNCFIQSAGAHSFELNEGFSGSGAPALACQLFNKKMPTKSVTARGSAASSISVANS
jgi:hypothetical protein